MLVWAPKLTRRNKYRARSTRQKLGKKLSRRLSDGLLELHSQLHSNVKLLVVVFSKFGSLLYCTVPHLFIRLVTSLARHKMNQVK